MLINPLGIKDEESVAFCIHITKNKKEKKNFCCIILGNIFLLTFPG